MIEQKTIDNGVTRLDVGPLTADDIGKAIEIVMAETYNPSTGETVLPVGYFANADRGASWHNEIERAVMDGDGLAAGVWLGATGAERGTLYGILIARPLAGAPADALVVRYESVMDEQHGGSLLRDAAKADAAQRGATLGRMVLVPAEYKFTPV